jgi:hypothetical protein
MRSYNFIFFTLKTLLNVLKLKNNLKYLKNVIKNDQEAKNNFIEQKSKKVFVSAGIRTQAQINWIRKHHSEPNFFGKL